MDQFVPIIVATHGFIEASRIFNPNEWTNGRSRGIVTSCGSKFATMSFGLRQIETLCASSRERVRSAVASLIEAKLPESHPGTELFAQDEALHLVIEGFFGSAKSLLDLLVQLLPAEALIPRKLRAFSKANLDGKEVVGYETIKALDAHGTERTRPIRELIWRHKQDWIDDLVAVRDDLIHPRSVLRLAMWELRLERVGGRWALRDVLVPTHKGQSLGAYCGDQMRKAATFCREFLQLVKPAS